jgi:predicted transcriptional regulator
METTKRESIVGNMEVRLETVMPIALARIASGKSTSLQAAIAWAVQEFFSLKESWEDNVEDGERRRTRPGSSVEHFDRTGQTFTIKDGAVQVVNWKRAIEYLHD